jgi:hypothetical protein
MIGRNRNWYEQSDWIKAFNRKHNPRYYYGEEKKQKKNQKQKNYTPQYKIFRQQD